MKRNVLKFMVAEITVFIVKEKFTRIVTRKNTDFFLKKKQKDIHFQYGFLSNLCSYVNASLTHDCHKNKSVKMNELN